MGLRKFVVVVEQAEGNFSAYSPDVPGCVATGMTQEETVQNMVEAIKFHLEGCAGPTSSVVSTNLVYV